ncbi:MAG: hypothetical protein JSS81_20650 [Acidobacteria bacterium]|nr:hypothetical protein [Acidobacteriota bacterium]
MSIRMKNKRRITVDGTIFYWLYRWRSQILELVVMIGDKTGTRLVYKFKYHDPWLYFGRQTGPLTNEWLIESGGLITPRVVRQAIDRAREQGWNPFAKGATFEIDETGGEKPEYDRKTKPINAVDRKIRIGETVFTWNYSFEKGGLRLFARTEYKNAARLVCDFKNDNLTRYFRERVGAEPFYRDKSLVIPLGLMTPRVARQTIDLALEKGWKPTVRGADFLMSEIEDKIDFDFWTKKKCKIVCVNEFVHFYPVHPNADLQSA